MFALGRPSDARLAAVLAEVAGADLTYPDVGATGRPGPLPAGYDHAWETAAVGHGDDAFAAAVPASRGGSCTGARASGSCRPTRPSRPGPRSWSASRSGPPST